MEEKIPAFALLSRNDSDKEGNMARYEHLPIYKAAMDLAVYMEKEVKNMSRYDKYTLGTELRQRAITAVTYVVRVNSEINKEPLLKELSILIEEIRQVLFIAKETGALASFGIYKNMMQRVETLSKQNAGWLKSQRKSES